MAAAAAAEAVDAEVAEAENGRVRQLPALSRGGGEARVDGRATVRKGRGHVTPLQDASKSQKKPSEAAEDTVHALRNRHDKANARVEN